MIRVFNLKEAELGQSTSASQNCYDSYLTVFLHYMFALCYIQDCCHMLQNGHVRSLSVFLTRLDVTRSPKLAGYRTLSHMESSSGIAETVSFL